MSFTLDPREINYILNLNNQENTMTNDHTPNRRGRRSPLLNIGNRLRGYTLSDKHYMTSKERNLMLDVSGALMSDGPFSPKEFGFLVDSIRKVSVAHTDRYLQKLADQASRWDVGDPFEESIVAAQQLESKAYGDYIVADDIDVTVKVIVDNDATRVTLEAIVLSIQATLDSPDRDWAEIAQLAEIARRLS